MQVTSAFDPLCLSKTSCRSLGAYHPAQQLQPEDSQSSIVTTPTDDLDAPRPRSPESPLTTTLQHAATTINDLTSAMANFSRMPSPTLPDSLNCCCGKGECANHQAWMEFKAKLESRLILCAGEVYCLRLPLDERLLTGVGVRVCRVAEHVFRGRPGSVTETRGLCPP